MKLIFAQGNPGLQYEKTRHNAGFIVVDRLADTYGAIWKVNDKFRAAIAEAFINGEKVLLAKPLSFYNETGQVARAIIDFYKLTPTNDMLVIHDELALPFGTLRIREKGSDAGNNGIKSLNAHLGEHYWRVRIGIWNELRDRMDDAAFVLSAFSQEEQQHVAALTDDKIVSIVQRFVSGQLEPTSLSV
jgi:peptidyl-tRNA hydrolase, PTH1 family